MRQSVPRNETLSALTRGLDLLATFADQPRCRFNDLASKTRIPRSSLYRFIGMLEARGFLRQDTETKEYFPGPLLYRIGHTGNGFDHLRQAVRAEMSKLVEKIGESAYLYVRDGAYRICVEVEETQAAAIKHVVKPGSDFPLYAGASGKAILAFLRDTERAQLLRNGGFKRYGPGTLTSRRALEQELERIRNEGYAYSEAELSADSWGLAVPLHDAAGNCIGSLGVAGPLFRLHRERIPEYAKFLRGLVGRIQRVL